MVLAFDFRKKAYAACLYLPLPYTIHFLTCVFTINAIIPVL